MELYLMEKQKKQFNIFNMGFAHCSETWLDLPYLPESLKNGPNTGNMQHLETQLFFGFSKGNNPPSSFFRKHC